MFGSGQDNGDKTIKNEDDKYFLSIMIKSISLKNRYFKNAKQYPYLLKLEVIVYEH